MMKKLNVFCSLLCLSAMTASLSAQDFTHPTYREPSRGQVNRVQPGEKPLPREVSRKQPEREQAGDGQLLGGRNWQRNHDLAINDVVLLRRSTDEPVPEGQTVIMRWRTPTEFERGRQHDSKARRPGVRGRFQL
jgi:hypothetical protein